MKTLAIFAECQWTLISASCSAETNDSLRFAQSSDIGHNNDRATLPSTWHQPLTCLNSWNAWHCLPPEVCSCHWQKDWEEGRRGSKGRKGRQAWQRCEAGRAASALNNRGPMCTNGNKQEIKQITGSKLRGRLK